MPPLRSRVFWNDALAFSPGSKRGRGGGTNTHTYSVGWQEGRKRRKRAFSGFGLCTQLPTPGGGKGGQGTDK